MKNIAVALALAGCALTQKSAPRELRYFTPPLSNVASHEGKPCGHIELGRVIASGSLRYPIQHEVSPVEIRPYETLRWTEIPDVFVKRSIARALYDKEPLEQTIGEGAVLDIDVIAFEETSEHAGRVRLRYELHDDTRVLSHGVITRERAAASQSIDQVVVAIGQALDEASGQRFARMWSRRTPHVTRDPVGAS